MAAYNILIVTARPFAYDKTYRVGTENIKAIYEYENGDAKIEFYDGKIEVIRRDDAIMSFYNYNPLTEKYEF